jgi:hypothetical protein
MILRILLLQLRKKTDYSLDTNGYQKLPSGLIIQWCRVSYTGGASGNSYSVSFNFPIAFPNACFSANVSVNNAFGDNWGQTCLEISPTKTGGTIAAIASNANSYRFASNTFYVIAVGY